MKPSSLIIAKILTLCGIALTCTACYGTPESRFEIKGKVTTDTNRPIEGIRVAAKYYEEDEREMGFSSTGAEGEYRIILYSQKPKVFYVVAKDVDGDENGGSFAAKTREIAFEDFHYLAGRYVKNINFELELTENTPDEE